MTPTPGPDFYETLVKDVFESAAEGLLVFAATLRQMGEVFASHAHAFADFAAAYKKSGAPE